ncbi:MAG TPA: hypothetical protein VGR73_18565 [Bryobacteraceae bacterium]|nr:hypothetical protein [Bryobacteraceae bacterium]
MSRAFATTASAFMFVGILSVPLAAQWVNLPTPGIPRTAAGKPNLTAPAPRTADGKPDLSGIWQRISPKYYENITADLKPGDVPAWAQDLADQRKENLHKEHMSLVCLPWGPSYATSIRLTKIIQNPKEIVMLDEGLMFRQIFMDGRKLEADPNPSWMGYSVAHWDGDTLVVESNGYNDRSWLDRDGHPHSEELRMTERYRRTNFGHLDIQVTLSDPKIYPKPWTVALYANYVPDTEVMESVCNETTAGREHWVGKASDEKKNEKQVAPEILAKYVGTYREQDLWGQGPHPRIIEITVVDGKVVAELKGRGKTTLIAQNDTLFSGFFGWGIGFVTDAQGDPQYLNEMHVSGNYRFQREK